MSQRYRIQQAVEFKPAARAETKAPLTKLQLLLKNSARTWGKPLLTRITTRSDTVMLWLPLNTDQDFIWLVKDNAESLGYKSLY